MITDVDDPSQAISHDDHKKKPISVPVVNKLLHRHRMLTMMRLFCLSALYASVSGFTAPRNAFLGNHVTSRYVQRLEKFIFIANRMLDDRYCQCWMWDQISCFPIAGRYFARRSNVVTLVIYFTDMHKVPLAVPMPRRGPISTWSTPLSWFDTGNLHGIWRIASRGGTTALSRRLVWGKPTKAEFCWEMGVIPLMSLTLRHSSEPSRPCGSSWRRWISCTFLL